MLWKVFNPGTMIVLACVCLSVSEFVEVFGLNVLSSKEIILFLKNNESNTPLQTPVTPYITTFLQDSPQAVHKNSFVNPRLDHTQVVNLIGRED